MLKTYRTIEYPKAAEGEYAMAKMHDLSADALAQLNEEEKQELESFTNLRRQREYLTSRLVLKGLAENFSMNADQFVILKDSLGCPYGTDHKDEYYVSIAHSNHNVFCGINDRGPIGVDLEPVGRRVPSRLMRRILHPADAELLAEMDPIRLWTLKESLIKLEGQGLRLNMNEVQIQQNTEGFFVELNKNKTAKICSFETNDNWLAIAFYL